jgi:hypothetical protein
MMAFGKANESLVCPDSFFRPTFITLIIGLCILLRVYQPIYIETSVRNKCRCSFYCALFTLHVYCKTTLYIDSLKFITETIRIYTKK